MDDPEDEEDLNDILMARAKRRRMVTSTASNACSTDQSSKRSAIDCNDTENVLKSIDGIINNAESSEQSTDPIKTSASQGEKKSKGGTPAPSKTPMGKSSETHIIDDESESVLTDVDGDTNPPVATKTKSPVKPVETPMTKTRGRKGKKGGTKTRGGKC